MVFSISFDWSENYDKESNEPRFNLDCPNTDHHNKFGYSWETKYESTKDLNGNKCKPYQGCDCCEDDSGHLEPMMNFIYPLDYVGFMEGKEGEQKRIEIASKTNCICIQDNESEEWYLALTGGGMDLSFSIAHAFMIAQKCLPIDLLNTLNAGWCKDNLDSKTFKELRSICIQQLDNEVSRFNEQKEKWNKPIEAITQ